jgi:hypothetical protein
MLDIDALVESKGLYKTDFIEYQFLWRLLTLKEYRIFAALRDNGALHPMVLYNMVFERCYVGNADFINLDIPAGVPISIGQLIMWISGDAANTTLIEDLEATRNIYVAESVEEHMKRIVLITMPSYTFEDVDSWTRPELYRKFVICETILLNKGSDYQPLDLKKVQRASDRSSSGIDLEAMQQDNRDIAQAMGDRQHILEQHPAELDKRRKIADAMQRRNARREHTPTRG